MALEKHNMSDNDAFLLNRVNLFFLLVFVVEMVLKIIALGFKGYVKDTMNVFDGTIVLIGILEEFFLADGFMSVVRLFRVFRMFRLMRSFPRFRALMVHFMHTFVKILSILVLLMLALFVLGLAGRTLFSSRMDFPCEVKPRHHFDSFGWAFLTNFQLMTGENWTDILYDTMRIAVYKPFFGATYCMISLIINGYIMLSLFLAVLIDEFSSKPQQESEQAVHPEKADSESNLPSGSSFILSAGSSFEEVATRLTTSRQSKNKWKLPERKNGWTNPEYTGQDTSRFSADFGKVISEPEITGGFPPAKWMPSIFTQKLESFGITVDSPVGLCVQDGHYTGRIVRTTSRGVEVLWNVDEGNPSPVPPVAFSFKHGFAVGLYRQPNVSLFMFPERHPMRMALLRVVRSYICETCVFTCILVSVVVMAMEDPMHSTPVPWVITTSLIINIIFTVEMVAKIVAYGFALHPYAYLRSASNWLDLLVVTVGWLEIAFPTFPPWMKSFRTLRVLRPLRMISRVPMLRAAIDAILSSIPAAFQVSIILFVFFSIFAVAGVQLFGGKFSSCSDPCILHLELCTGYWDSTLGVTLGVGDPSADNFQCEAPRWNIQRNLSACDDCCNPHHGCENSTIHYFIAEWNGTAPDLGLDVHILGEHNNHTIFGFQTTVVPYTVLENPRVATAYVLPYKPYLAPPPSYVLGQSICPTTFCNIDRTTGPTGEKRVVTRLPFHFDDFMHSLLTLFEVATLSSWVNVWYRALDGAGKELGPCRDASPVVGGIFFVVYLFLCSFFALNLFVSVVIENFQAKIHAQGMKPIDRQFLSHVNHICKRYRSPALIRVQPWQVWLRTHVVECRMFEGAIMAIICTNLLFMCTYTVPEDRFSLYRESIDWIVLSIFVMEAALKILVLQVRNYFADGWNKFDFFVAFGTLAALVGSGVSGFIPVWVSIIIKILRSLRIFRMLRHGNPGLIIKSAIISLPSVLNILLLLLLLFLIATLAGMNMFGTFPYGERLDVNMNFRSFSTSIMTLVILATGEYWNDIMHDLYEPPACHDRGNPQHVICPEPALVTMDTMVCCPSESDWGQTHWTAILFCLVFNFLMGSLLLNVIIGIVLETFSVQRENAKMNITVDMFSEFEQTWYLFDIFHTRLLHVTLLPNLLARLPSIFRQFPARIGSTDKEELPIRRILCNWHCVVLPGDYVNIAHAWVTLLHLHQPDFDDEYLEESMQRAYTRFEQCSGVSLRSYVNMCDMVFVDEIMVTSLVQATLLAKSRRSCISKGTPQKAMQYLTGSRWATLTSIPSSQVFTDTSDMCDVVQDVLQLVDSESDVTIPSSNKEFAVALRYARACVVAMHKLTHRTEMKRTTCAERKQPQQGAERKQPQQGAERKQPQQGGIEASKMKPGLQGWQQKYCLADARLEYDDIEEYNVTQRK